MHAKQGPETELSLLSLFCFFLIFGGRRGVEQSFSETGSCVVLVGFEFDR